MITSIISSTDIVDNIYIPKYYDKEIKQAINRLAVTHEMFVLGDYIDSGIIEVRTGDEIGKMSYGTGDIPFIRTSDISNWEIKSVPKQGISNEIYERYASKQDVQEGDILMVRDGSYLIGVNCVVQSLDLPMLYQSHILKFRVIDKSVLDPTLFFLALNTPIVQRQIRAMQFTADIIDTLGNRYRELRIPISRSVKERKSFSKRAKASLEKRLKSRLLVKQFPKLMEDSLFEGNVDQFDRFLKLPTKYAEKELISDTSTLELGQTNFFTISSNEVTDNILIPKYYDPSIRDEFLRLNKTCDEITINDFINEGVIQLNTGDEIGKMAYGTGDIPFVRTTDFSNWEIKHNAKQLVSEDIYQQYCVKEDVRENDILLVRDGSYLVGNSCLITSDDTKMLFCGGLIKMRSLDKETLSPYLLFGLLNSYIVKRQIRTKQFTRDIIDTLGNRLPEVVLPIPRSKELCKMIESQVKEAISLRTKARNEIKKLSNLYAK